MKELAMNHKASLVALLESHHAIKEKNFIDAIASNEEEKLNLTLMAYAIEAEQMNTPTNVPMTLVQTKTSIVVIDELHSKLQFVKAIEIAKDLPIKEAKDYADHMLIEQKGMYGQFYSKPFMIEDYMDSIFTEEQWEKICEYMKDDMSWKYV